MTENTRLFETWYASVFGQLPGHDDPENKETVKRIWNGALEHAAQQFEFQIFAEMTGNQVAESIRAMQTTATL